MNISNKIFALFLLSSFALPSLARSRAGPHVLWVNLAQNRHLDDLINQRLAKDDDCLSPGASFTPLPSWISIELVKKAVLKNEEKAISELDKLMRRRYDNYRGSCKTSE